jgi:hypothetical protein
MDLLMDTTCAHRKPLPVAPPPSFREYPVTIVGSYFVALLDANKSRIRAFINSCQLPARKAHLRLQQAVRNGVPAEKYYYCADNVTNRDQYIGYRYILIPGSNVQYYS